MSYYDNCAKEGLLKSGDGSVLLRFILNYLSSNSEKYDISRVLLTDNSYLICESCDDNIKLARLRLITHGQTWYMKYGFKPYNAEKQKPDCILMKNIEMDRKKLEKLETRQIPILKIIQEISKESINFKLEEMERLQWKYKLLKNFVTRLTKEYEKYCCLLVYILKFLFEGRGKQLPILFDTYKKSYYWDL